MTQKNKFFFIKDSILGWTFQFKKYNNIRYFFKELKWGWQRFIRGYDDRALLNGDIFIREFIINLLRHKIRYDVALLAATDDEGYRLGTWFSRIEGNIELRKMIKYFILSDEDALKQYLYGDKWYDLNPIEINNQEIYNKRKEYSIKALNYLKKYYDELWW